MNYFIINIEYFFLILNLNDFEFIIKFLILIIFFYTETII